MPGALLRRALLLAAALLAGGCASMQRCALPEARLAPPLGPTLPARAEVAWAAALPAQETRFEWGDWSYVFPTGAAAAAAFGRASAQLLASPVAPAASDTGVPAPRLDWGLEEVRLQPGPFRPEAAEVTVSAALAVEGRRVARAVATARGEGAPVHGMGFVHCDASGEALAQALGAATSAVRDALGADPAVAAWARAAGPPPADGASPPRAPDQPPASTRWHRATMVPRYLELGAASGTGWSHAPGIGRVAGPGWTLRAAWDAGERLAIGLHAGAARVRVDWTPDPGQPTDGAELGFAGLELQWRARPGQRLRPWFAATGAWQGVLWDSYLYSVAGFGLLASAGLDVGVTSWGAVRLAVSASAFTATTSSSVGAGPAPGPGEDGWTSGVRTLWFGAGWLFDLGPAR